MATIPFIKMHGTGNDFVIVDARQREVSFAPGKVHALADRHTGIGFDQLIVLKTSTQADIFMQIINADGSEVNACGNASRCIGWMIAQEKNATEVKIETNAGILEATLITPTVFGARSNTLTAYGSRSDTPTACGGGKGGADYNLSTRNMPPPLSPPASGGSGAYLFPPQAVGIGPSALQAGGIIKVDMGVPKFDWQEIPITSALNTENVPVLLDGFKLPPAFCVNMGNPHAVFFVGTHERVDLHEIGAKIEHHPLFPERVNVSIARVIDDTHIKLDVWERGAGITQSCGTAACATLVAAVKKGLVAPAKAGAYSQQKNINERMDPRLRGDDVYSAIIQLPGGDLLIEWGKTTNHVWMTGAVAESFRGEVEI